ncbi:MAG: carbohydrate-selective porin OprB [Bacteroidetes bacterium]|jgi:high affinity Mn2+ porin|nr:carbohydrate-selective porin OprB [Bacteroidota bacterium]
MNKILPGIILFCVYCNALSQSLPADSLVGGPAGSQTGKYFSSMSRYVSISAQVITVYQKPFNFTSDKLAKNTAGKIAWKNEHMALFDLPLMITPWKNGEITITPEFTWGNAVGGSAGLGGFVNGVFGAVNPTPYIFKAQFSQKFENKNEKGFIKSVELTAGKIYIQEHFDLGTCSGDPNSDFLNFNHIMPAAWDVATSSFGYTYGTGIRINRKNDQLNFAAITVNKKPSTAETDWDIKNGHGLNLQYVRRFKLASCPASLRALTFYNRAYSGVYNQFKREALNNAVFFPSELKSYQVKYGFAFGGDITLNNIGLFTRFSWNNGKSEAMHYTEADQSFNLGMVYRPEKFRDNLLGIAASINALSNEHRFFLENGGAGFMMKAGIKEYDEETALEFFYRFHIMKNISATINYQFMFNPGYDKQNATADFLACRFNFSF